MKLFDTFLETLRKDLEEVVIRHGADLKEELIADGTAFAEKMKEDLVRWSEQMANGELSKEDLEWLLAAKKDLAEMQELKIKGITQIRIDRIRNSIVETIIGSVIRVM